MTITYIRDYDQLWQDIHTDLAIVTYPKMDGKRWRCRRCGHFFPPAARRITRHAPQLCTGGPDSRCWAGPFCAHCVEVDDARS